ncbi:hypothetical protein NC653_031121 [Populus alba x Populus x berolinensis]|uniref:Uncharacterized protein n=1 Tax=Populus alba x Populus x berolinensis TaxID=444605 RepID=A0AAD6Q154_9ROSI|nr:hypothetical protein NC653_031121 [Populus alba x Populus x berolinensis]
MIESYVKMPRCCVGIGFSSNPIEMPLCDTHGVLLCFIFSYCLDCSSLWNQLSSCFISLKKSFWTTPSQLRSMVVGSYSCTLLALESLLRLWFMADFLADCSLFWLSTPPPPGSIKDSMCPNISPLGLKIEKCNLKKLHQLC